MSKFKIGDVIQVRIVQSPMFPGDSSATTDIKGTVTDIEGYYQDEIGIKWQINKSSRGYR